ncbi:uncharacterized protein LOC143030698 [Oratosquilla oratoria]|uniref:uncharacterized protein LOC143030698 n=1 Tax=Oratosquilla oratoria TaxID=337810 RepID=UPI003F776632
MRGSTSNLLIVILGGAMVCQVLSAVVDLHPSSSFSDPNRHLLRRSADPVARPDARPAPEAKADPHYGVYSYYRPYGFGYRFGMPYYGFGPYYGYGSFGYWR